MLFRSRDKDVQYECKKLMSPADRTCDGADGEEEDGDEEVEARGSNQGIISTAGQHTFTGGH